MARAIATASAAGSNLAFEKAQTSEHMRALVAVGLAFLDVVANARAKAFQTWFGSQRPKVADDLPRDPLSQLAGLQGSHSNQPARKVSRIERFTGAGRVANIVDLWRGHPSKRSVVEE